MFLARKNENEAMCRGDAQRAHLSPSSGPPDLSLSLSHSRVCKWMRAQQLAGSVGDRDRRDLEVRFPQALHEGRFHCTFPRHGQHVAKFMTVCGLMPSASTTRLSAPAKTAGAS